MKNMKHARHTLLFLCSALLCAVLSAQTQTSASAPVTLYPSGKPIETIIPHNHAYHQSLVYTLGVAFAPYEGNSRRRDSGPGIVRKTFEQAAEFIQKVDRASDGMPKIVFLVGWQYEGHDSKYPAFFEVNKALKRPQDKTALDSLLWLIAEGRKYNTTVSFHINLTDSYEDSPLWDEYLKNNVIGRLEDGSIRKAKGWGYPISYAQELKTGLLQKRVDKLFDLLPLKELGVVHVDAFHTWSPLDPRGPMSPWLGFTVEDEEEAQRQIFLYFASKGANITSEFVRDFRDSAFEGYQPLAWHFRISAQEYLDWPASYYCGGQDKTDLGRVFGTNIPVGNLNNFNRNFCAWTVPCYFLNRLERKSYTVTDTYQEARFANDVVSRLDNDGHYTLKQGDRLMMENENVFVPALWMEGKAIIAYSTDGYEEKTWDLPPDWSGVSKAELFDVTPDAVTSKGAVTIQNNRLTISVPQGRQILIKAQ